METSYFKVSCVLIICLSLYGAYMSYGINYLESFISVLTFPIFFVFGILLTMLVMSFQVYNNFDKNKDLIIRLETKGKYLKELIKNVVIINFLVYLIILIIIMIGLNLFPKDGMGFIYNQSLNTYNILYLIFVIVRNFIIIQIIIVCSILLRKIFNDKLVVVLNMILYFSLIIFFYNRDIVINSIWDMCFFIGEYLVVMKYGNFIIEIMFTTFYILILCGMSIVLFLWIRKKMNQVGD